MSTAATVTIDGTVRLSAATAFRLTFVPSRQFVQLLSKLGTFWIKRYAPGATVPPALPTAAAIPAAAAASDYVEMTDGDIVTFGDSSMIGVRRVLGAPGAVAVIDVWCEVAGDVVYVTQ